MVLLLSDFEVNVNLTLARLMAPLHVAARFSCAVVAKLLIENGADPNTASRQRSVTDATQRWRNVVNSMSVQSLSRKSQHNVITSKH